MDFMMLMGLKPPYPIPEDLPRRALKDEPPDEQLVFVSPEMHAMRGLTQDKRGIWIVRTTMDKVEHKAGRFKDIEAAKFARDQLEKRLGKTITVQVRKGMKRGVC